MTLQTLANYSIQSLEELEAWKVSVSGLIVRNNEILIVRQDPNTSHRLRGCWRFPTGKLESKENPVSGMKREILEESGIETIIDETPIDIKTLTHVPQPDCKGTMIIYYQGRPEFESDIPHTRQGEDVVEARYVNPRELRKYLGEVASRELTYKVIQRLASITGRNSS